MKKFLIIQIVIGGLLMLWCQSWCQAVYADEVPPLYIHAINPGYSVGGVANVGEMIEIGRNTLSDESISLAGTAVGYTNSSGNYSMLFEFPENSWMTGEKILLRLASSPESELAAVTYTKTLAMKAGLTLEVDGTIVDEVCWNGKDDCYKVFDSSHPSTLVRNLETNEFEHWSEYEPAFDEDSYYEEEVEEVDETGDGGGLGDGDTSGAGGVGGSGADGCSMGGSGVSGSGSVGGSDAAEIDEEDSEDEHVGMSWCEDVHFSEILTYYNELASEQFIEFYNSGTVDAVLTGCKVRYKKKDYQLEGVIGAGEYFIYQPEFRLTKNPTSMGEIELIDENGNIIDTLEYPNGQKKDTTFALVGEDEEMVWAVTYALTPGAKNVFQRFRTCEAGKIINELTGNCIKEEVVVEKTCAEGYFLNPESGRCKKEQEVVERVCQEGYFLNESTGRCKKVVVATIKTCQEGYYVNPLTGRCKKIEVVEAKTCAEGYYLNEETGRCRKIKENTGADYGLVPTEYEEKSSFVALYAVLLVVGLGAIYLIYEYRKEIVRLLKRIFRR